MKRMMQAAVFCALIVISAWLSLPLPGISLTLQTLAVALCGYCLGWKYALGAVAAYLLLGGFGLPVFSGFSGGIGWMLGPGGGYLFGFLFLAFACGLPAKKRGARLLFGAVGLAVVHLCGSAWYAFCTHVSFWQGLLVGSLPFIAKALFCFLAAEYAANKMGIFKKRY